MIHKEMEPTNNESEQKGNEGRAVRGPEILVYVYIVSLYHLKPLAGFQI